MNIVPNKDGKLEDDELEKDNPSPDSSHVPTTEWNKKPRIAAFSSVTKAVDEEERYTFSPWYVPDRMDAHNEWTDKKEVQQAFWKYLAAEDRDIRLQHNTDIVAGQWVEGATWPFEVTVPVKHPEGDTEYTFPAGTPFLGIIWEPWAWELIKKGDIRGLSIGGTANRSTIEMSADDYEPTGKVAFAKMIEEKGGKYSLYSKDGSRHLGTFATKEEAEAREAEINRIKNMQKRSGFIMPSDLFNSAAVAKQAIMITEPSDEGLAAELCDLLGDVVAFRFIAQGFHWNVKGILFQQFHELFQEIYEDADSSIDPIAENIRKLNYDAPFRLSDFMGSLADLEIPETNDAALMSQLLYVANEQVKTCIVKAFALANVLQEQGIANFLAERQNMHAKWQWQLRAIVGDAFADAYEVDVKQINAMLTDSFMKHLGARHDQSSHAKGSGKFPRVEDVPATPDQAQATVDAAIALRSSYAKGDERRTTEMTKLAADLGMEPVALEHRLKSTESLARKIQAEADRSYGGDVDKAAADISDTARYTFVADEANYTQNLSDTVSKLEDAGYSVRVKNFWEQGDPYQGVNLKLKRNGETIELQLHTKSSLEFKEKKIHPLYQQYRKTDTPMEEKKALWASMVALANEIPLPANYDKLLDYQDLVFQQFGS
jgi:starvation-inducible DNA-binding protein